MSKIESHVVKGDYFSEHVHVKSIGEAGNGGAHFKYVIQVGEDSVNLVFQQGDPVKKLNGIANEALVAVVLDRLRGFQAGEFPSNETQGAINHLTAALDYMQKRTKDRIKRGVIGRLKP